MKRLFILPIVFLAFCACSKDDDNTTVSDENDPHIVGQAAASYVAGRTQSVRRLSTMTEGNTTQFFAWSNDVTPRLTAVGPEDDMRQIVYDAQSRQTQITIPASTLGHTQTLNFSYKDSGLSGFTWTEGVNTLLNASIYSVGNRVITINYSDIDYSLLSQYISSYLPTLNNRKEGIVDDIHIDNINVDYNWVDSNISSAYYTATARLALKVGELTDALHLDASFYEMMLDNMDLGDAASFITPELIEQLVDALADSTCDIAVNLDMTYNYAYTSSPNPLQGILAWGLWDAPQVFSSCNVDNFNRTGIATVNIHLNLPTYNTSIPLTMLLMALNALYPDGLDYSYPIDLSDNGDYEYTLDGQGWPTTRSTSDGTITTFTYEN